MSKSPSQALFRPRVLIGINAVFLLLLGATLLENSRFLRTRIEDQALAIDELKTRLGQVEASSRVLDQRLCDKQSSLVRLEALEEGLEQRLQENAQRTAERLTERFDSISKQVLDLDSGQALHSQDLNLISQALDSLSQDLAARPSAPDPKVTKDVLDRLMDSAVRVNARTEVGSGVVVFNAQRGRLDQIETYILTAYHVIKDNIASKTQAETPLELDFYQAGQKSHTALARIVEVEPRQDLALLRVTSEVHARAATMANADVLKSKQRFSEIVTVGCPLGYAPMLTRGEVSATDKLFDEQRFWMINAPTIFGNSGGGVFDSKTGILLGVLIRIAAYKNVIDVAVPHLGIVTPLDQVASWLASTPYSFISEAFQRPQASSVSASSPKSPESKAGTESKRQE